MSLLVQISHALVQKLVQTVVQMKVHIALGVVQKMAQIALGVVQKTVQIALGVVQKNGANCTWSGAKKWCKLLGWCKKMVQIAP